MGEYIFYEGAYLHAVDLLRNIRYKVKDEWKTGLSAHILVCPDGDIIRCRQDDQGAYHAAGYNDDSLGIEFLVKGTHDSISFRRAIKKEYLTPEQYQSGMEFVRDEWRIKKGILNLARHSDVSPERKVDPGEGFPWGQFLREVGVRT
jgi:N-acetylmuramoyl-L-alanine amidase